ncbi:MAG: SemiSWEET transporter [Solobacterium sp.]|jgi:MtN3 and saliva related transmembrane protein|nr:SemiSWEET transporter [Solobacterium sp.]MCH4206352.1 SemiSWEET transporter [Solobacterium sp.]MCH4227854.1 SemiSWEET transporter [Solobacterium sp.]MCH4283253.1 SemiSWEET transporter [Solobacterium sp.]
MIGTIAAVLTTSAFLPQVIKVIRTKDTTGISLLMYIIQVTGIGLWAAYGFMLQNPALYVANSITFILSSIILFYKIKYH